MTIGTPTDQGVAQTTPGVSATNTVTSASFSPTGGNRVIVVVQVTLNLGSAPSFTLSDTFTGTGTWTEHAAGAHNFGSGTYYQRLAIWSAVLGGSPGTGTITVTRSAGNVDQWMCAQFYEVSGTGGVGATGAPGYDTTSPVNVTLSASPASTSLLVGGCFSGANGAANVTPPTGWTETSETLAPSAWFAIHEAAWKNGSGAQSNDWTIGDTINGMSAVAVEFTEATGNAVPTTVLVNVLIGTATISAVGIQDRHAGYPVIGKRRL